MKLLNDNKIFNKMNLELLISYIFINNLLK